VEKETRGRTGQNKEKEKKIRKGVGGLQKREEEKMT
jgi:hypothetical protein